MTDLRRPLLLALVAILATTACTSPDRPTVQADEVPLPTPLRSFEASMTMTVGAVEAALGQIGERLALPVTAYRPAEPAGLLQVPRVIRRVDLADLDDGYVVVYQAESTSDAAGLADELADYLGSGFGQTNFVADTQFGVSVLDDTVIFTTWSQRRSDDPERAEAAFEAIREVGTAVEVVK